MAFAIKAPPNSRALDSHREKQRAKKRIGGDCKKRARQHRVIKWHAVAATV